jgi:outer membrane protein TolC
MKTLLCIWVVLLSGTLFAQNNIETILVSIENNNITLKALREEAEAKKFGNKAGIYLANPEIEYNYLWGSPDVIGNRTDVSIRQTFDIPTIAGMKSRIGNKQNSLVELQYKTERTTILLQAKQLCIDLMYYDALKKEQIVRLQHAETVADGYGKKLKQGDTGITEYNKVQLNLLSARGELSHIEIEYNTVLSELKRLNGGMELALEGCRYEDTLFPVNFDDWYASAKLKNPVLEYVSLETEISKDQVALNKVMGLPSFSAGYMSEKMLGEHFQGITFGVSVPLWGNKNRVKQAKVAAKAAVTRQEDSWQRSYNHFWNLYERTNGLKDIADNYKKSLAVFTNTDLLKKALDAGEISVLEYVTEIGLYYGVVNKALEAERDYRKARAELEEWEL